jgi:hypothetical protein
MSCSFNPQDIPRLASYRAPLFPLANPRAPQSVKPIPCGPVSQRPSNYYREQTPIRFQTAMCQPSTFGAGVYQFFCVSSMNSVPETMKPVPPMTWGSQYAPFCAAVLVRRLRMGGRAVKPAIQKMVAPIIWERQARKPTSLK